MAGEWVPLRTSQYRKQAEPIIMLLLLTNSIKRWSLPLAILWGLYLLVVRRWATYRSTLSFKFRYGLIPQPRILIELKRWIRPWIPWFSIVNKMPSHCNLRRRVAPPKRSEIESIIDALELSKFARFNSLWSVPYSPCNLCRIGKSE